MTFGLYIGLVAACSLALSVALGAPGVRASLDRLTWRALRLFFVVNGAGVLVFRRWTGHAVFVLFVCELAGCLWSMRR